MAKATLKTHYSLAEMAEMMGVSQKSLQMRADRGQLVTEQFAPRGKRFVLLSSFREQFPGLWEAMLDRAQLQQSAEG
jgi:hypothetical protein